tara:strand:- start:9194 stop:10384 length:1191 start_codon:yes stop_codon:yes gene_type:complete
MGILRYIMPVLVLGTGVAISAGIYAAKPEPEKKEVVIEPRKVRVITARRGAVDLTVESQGTVQPRHMIDLVPEVAGKIDFVSEKFVAGGRFTKGEVILKIDPRDYQAAVYAAEARVAEAEQHLIREQQEAELARQEWEMLGKGEPTDLVLRKPQLADAEAKLKAARADLDKARLDLERTVIRAPFNGLLTQKLVDLGQFISPGSRLGVYYSTDILEVRLPLSNRDLGKLDLSRLHEGAPLSVTLTGSQADRESRWKGRIVRTEGVIDTKTRILYVVAELSGEELRAVDTGTPITIGQFVAARIEGRSYGNAIRLPREALRQGNSVLVVDQENKLRTRQVRVLDANRQYVVIDGGLDEGEQVCISQLGIAVDGTLVEAVPVDKGSTLSARTDGEDKS